MNLHASAFRQGQSKLEDIAKEETKLSVLVISDNPDYASAAKAVFDTNPDTLTDRTMSRKDIDRLVNESRTKSPKNGGHEPDVIVFDMYSVSDTKLGEQFSLMKAIGSKYPYAALIGTSNWVTHSKLFGHSQRNDALLSMWGEILSERRTNPITQVYRIAYPSGRDSKDAQRIFLEGFTNLLNDTLNPVTRQQIFEYQHEKNRCKLFGVDLDDTLLDDDGKISDKNMGALRRLGQDVPIAFASGRPPASMIEIARLVGPEADWYIISHNGSLVLNQSGDVLYERTIKKEDATMLLGRFGLISGEEPFKGNILLNYFAANELFSVRDDTVADLRSSYIERIGRLKYHIFPDLSSMEKMVDALEPHKILIIVRANYKGAVKEFNVVASEAINSAGSLVVNPSHKNYFEFTHPEATKAKALEKVIETFGISMRNVAYVGNGLNDADALQIVGYPFLVKNYDPALYRKLKESGHLHKIEFVSTNNEDGVAEAIGKLRSYTKVVK